MSAKRTASIPFLILRLMVPKIRQLQLDVVYPNYFFLSKNVSLARYLENRNQSVAMGTFLGNPP